MAKRRTHSLEFKQSAVEASNQLGASIAGVAMAHGINANQLHKWRRQLLTPKPGAGELTISGVEVAASAAAVALLELLASSMLRCGKIARHVVIRCAPYFVMVILVWTSNGLNARETWFAAVGLALVVGVLLSGQELKDASRRRHAVLASLPGYLRLAIMPTLATALRVGTVNSVLVIITIEFGATEAGIWSNLYRAVSSPIFFLFTLSQTVMLMQFGQIAGIDNKLSLSRRRWYQFSAVCLTYVAIIFAGNALLLKIYPEWTSVTFALVTATLCVAIYRVFSQHVEVTLQVIGLSGVSILICGAECLVIVLAVSHFGRDLENFVRATAGGFMVLLTAVLIAASIFPRFTHRLKRRG